MKVIQMANKFFIAKPNGQKFVCFVDTTKTSWSQYVAQAWAFRTEKAAEDAIALIRKVQKVEREYRKAATVSAESADK